LKLHKFFEPLEEGVDKEKFNEAVQKALLELNAKDIFTQALK